MATNILTVGDTAENSSDVVVVAGTPLTACLKYTGAQTDDGAIVDILLKDDAGAYWPIGKLTAYSPSTIITGPGSYRFSRRAGASCGVFGG